MTHRALARQGRTARLRLPERFDIMSSAEYRISFARFLLDAEAEELAVDCGSLEYIDSLGIGTLLSWDRSCRRSGKQLVLEDCDASVRRILRLAGVGALLTCAPPAAAATPVRVFRFA